MLSHGNYRDVVSMVEQDAVVLAGDVAYLFLPLAHSFALLIQLAVLDMGATLAFFGGDPKQIVPELSEVKPTYLPSVPRIFEKLYTLVTAHGDAEQIKGATQIGLKVRALQAAGQEVPAELQAMFDAADEKLFKNVRAAFGGNLRQATSGAAPIAKEILEFFFACGVPVLEGFGMTETATASTVSTIDELPLRLGRAARCPGSRSGSPTTARCCSRARTSSGATTRTTTRRSARSTTAGCTRATSARSTRTATSTSPGARRTSSSPPAART